ncbi:hypothetical protein M8818_005266 [Zalaria obscura]|uniref:Uncharacterized protein n=1 Tax=Zalaria obscura TaxID=2024903 RepID=A0ACC3S9Z4_9PEZI
MTICLPAVFPTSSPHDEGDLIVVLASCPLDTNVVRRASDPFRRAESRGSCGLYLGLMTKGGPLSRARRGPRTVWRNEPLASRCISILRIALPIEQPTSPYQMAAPANVPCRSSSAIQRIHPLA